MALLDQRLSAKKVQPAGGLVAKKVRRIGHPSKTVPPAGAPSWAVRTNCLDEFTSMCHYMICDLRLSAHFSQYVQLYR